MNAHNISNLNSTASADKLTQKNALKPESFKSEAINSEVSSVSLLSYRRARQFAEKCGFPIRTPFSSQDVIWQIASNDSTMSAQIEIRDNRVVAMVNMNYIGKSVQMIRVIFDGKNQRSEGLLYRDDTEKAIACLQMHLVNMLHGPVMVPMRESA